MSLVGFFSYKKVLNEAYRDGYVMSEEELAGLQKTLLEIYADLMEVCDRHELRPFLQGGSLLGKIRHDGFIPWDDDLDLGMSREDYEKLKQIFETELSDKYILRVPGGPTGASNRFMQIFKKNSYYETDDENGNPRKISIDIFPVDYASNSAAARYIKGQMCNVLMIIASCVERKTNYELSTKHMMKRSTKMRINMMVRLVIGTVFSYRKMEDWFVIIDRFIRGRRVTEYSTNSTGRKHYLGEMLKTEVFYPVKESEYCGIRAWLPNIPEAYLANLYGDDYMVIPDENHREYHYVRKIIFDTEEE